MPLTLRALLVALAAVAWLALTGSRAAAQDYCAPGSPPDLFYNYYVAPVPCGPYGPMGAQLYVAPRPTPPLVGHTYITYQALMPHEFLYKHRRTYYRYHGEHGGLTKTRVTWR
jgi:hypothetical protein